MRFNVFSQRKPGSALALAIALACGTAVAAVGVAEPAHAQKKKKQAKADYSKEFIAAYQPLEEALNAEGTDIAGLSGQINAMIPLLQSPDEKLAGGNLVYNAGAKSSNQALQLQGMELMLASGKVGAENLGQYNFVAYQLANALEQYDKARTYLAKAIEYDFSSGNVTSADLRVAMAESYISEKRLQEGLDYLSGAIAERKAAGEAVDETWYRRGLQVGYQNELPGVYDFVTGWVEEYPSQENWRDAINIARNLNTYQPAQTLDLMRLAFLLDTLNQKQDYIEYVEAADARRLPQEVATVIEQGYSSGRVSKDDIFIADSLKLAKTRIASDKAELPSLERDASASGAALRTVVAAGDAFLNYGEYAKAEAFYAKAATMPGVNAAEVNTRLGIAQVHQGKLDEASANFAKVDGPRQPIARLWLSHIATIKASTGASGAATASEADTTAGA